MKKFVCLMIISCCVVPAWAGITAVEVVNSNVTFGHSNYTNLDTVLGEIRRDTGGTYVVTPWNCPWAPTEITIIASGSLTVKLSDYAHVTEGVKELGIYTAQMHNLTTGSRMNGDMGASIYVSENGTDWVALNNGEAMALNTPSLGYQFPNNILPNYSQYDGSLSELEETDLYKSFDSSGITDWTDTSAVLAAYGDSAGGNWFDLSGTGLDRIQYVKLDNIYGTDRYNSLRLDGFVAVPEPATMLILGLGGLLMRKKRNSF